MNAAPTMTRRRFLRADVQARPVPLRPPWAVPESRFVELCTRCGDCLRVCAPAILRPDGRGFPEVDFSGGECTFCTACAAACPTGALSQADPAAGPWTARAVIDATCLAQRGVMCAVCREHCASDAITLQRLDGRAPLPRVDSDVCTGCGACLAPCPAGSIRILADGRDDKAREAPCT